VRREISPGTAAIKYEGLMEVVQRIWVAAEQPCGKRLGGQIKLGNGRLTAESKVSKETEGEKSVGPSRQLLLFQ
jgi:hypothetical protein